MRVITVKRRSWWSRVLQVPQVFRCHYRICRGNGCSALLAAEIAARLTLMMIKG